MTTYLHGTICHGWFCVQINEGPEVLGKDGKPVIKISIDAYRKQTTNDYFRLLKLLELQAEWDMEDINAAYDYIAELEKELTEQKSREGVRRRETEHC